MVSLPITRTLLHTQLSYQAHQELTAIWQGSNPTQTNHQSLHHTRQQGDEHTGWMRQSHPRNDGQNQNLSRHAGPATYHWCNTSSLTGTSQQIWGNHNPEWSCNTQWVPRVQAPPSISKPHIDDNRQITCSMQPQSPVPRVPANKPTRMPPASLLACQASNPTPCLLICPNVKVFESSKLHNFAMLQLQPA